MVSVESFKAFFQQSKYGARLEDAKMNLDKKAKEFEETVNMCFRREVHDIHNNVEWLKAPILATFSLLAGFTKDFPGECDPTWEMTKVPAHLDIAYRQPNLHHPSGFNIKLKIAVKQLTTRFFLFSSHAYGRFFIPASVSGNLPKEEVEANTHVQL